MSDTINPRDADEMTLHMAAIVAAGILAGSRDSTESLGKFSFRPDVVAEKALNVADAIQAAHTARAVK